MLTKSDSPNYLLTGEAAFFELDLSDDAFEGRKEVPGGIGHVYDTEYSYPTLNADIGMILGRFKFWILVEGWQASQLWQNSLERRRVMIDPSIAGWTAERVLGNIQNCLVKFRSDEEDW